MLVQGALFDTTGTTGSDSLNTGRFQMLQDRVRIVGLVGCQTAGFQFPEQGQGFGTVARLHARQVKAGQHAQPIDQCMDLGAQSTSRATDGLVAFWLRRQHAGGPAR
jgi:hypothetical protein